MNISRKQPGYVFIKNLKNADFRLKLMREHSKIYLCRISSRPMGRLFIAFLYFVILIQTLKNCRIFTVNHRK